MSKSEENIGFDIKTLVSGEEQWETNTTTGFSLGQLSLFHALRNNEPGDWLKLELASLFRPGMLVQEATAPGGPLLYVVDATEYSLALLEIGVGSSGVLSDLSLPRWRLYSAVRSVAQYTVWDYTLTVQFSEAAPPVLLLDKHGDGKSVAFYIAEQYADLLTRERLLLLLSELKAEYKKSGSKFLLVLALVEHVGLPEPARTAMLARAKAKAKAKAKAREDEAREPEVPAVLEAICPEEVKFFCGAPDAGKGFNEEEDSDLDVPPDAPGKTRRGGSATGPAGSSRGAAGSSTGAAASSTGPVGGAAAPAPLSPLSMAPSTPPAPPGPAGPLPPMSPPGSPSSRGSKRPRSSSSSSSSGSSSSDSGPGPAPPGPDDPPAPPREDVVRAAAAYANPKVPAGDVADSPAGTRLCRLTPVARSAYWFAKIFGPAGRGFEGCASGTMSRSYPGPRTEQRAYEECLNYLRRAQAAGVVQAGAEADAEEGEGEAAGGPGGGASGSGNGGAA